MPLMVGLPNVGRAGAAVDAGRWPTDGRRRSAVSPAIANLAHGEVLARATGSSLYQCRRRAGPANPSLPPHVVVAYFGVVTHHGKGCQPELHGIFAQTRG